MRKQAPRYGNFSRTIGGVRYTGAACCTIDGAARRPLYTLPGNWNDPDKLFVGTGNFDGGPTGRGAHHFSLWAMLSAPLIIGYDCR